ncbi:MAG TPA: cyclase family protein [Candidatus Dormibacteraeota bacterium]|nr:cyclase family protein [Candidatus Dormibacteraeota bacterium]
MREPWRLLEGARVYDLAQPLEASTPTSPNHPAFRMALMRRHGDSIRADGGSGANELFTMGGHTGTHIDALCHVSHGMKLHGGLDAAEASRGGGFRQLGVETVAPMVCRGVLLDIPRALGREALEAAHPVTADELERTCAAQGVEVRAGDAVLVRSGWPVGRYQDAAAFAGLATGVPGPDESAARWLASRLVRVTGADTIAYEWLVPGAGHARLPVHTILLVENGIHIVEVMALEELARDRVHEFLFVLAPLKLVGATGSPVRPLAIPPA